MVEFRVESVTIKFKLVKAFFVLVKLLSAMTHLNDEACRAHTFAYSFHQSHTPTTIHFVYSCEMVTYNAVGPVQKYNRLLAKNFGWHFNLSTTSVIFVVLLSHLISSCLFLPYLYLLLHRIISVKVYKKKIRLLSCSDRHKYKNVSPRWVTSYLYLSIDLCF